MGFKISYGEDDVKSEFDLVAEGKYEVVIVGAEANEWQGNHSLKINVEIRSDVPQKHQGAKVLYSDFYMSPGKPEYEEDRKKKAGTFLAACGYPPNAQLDLDDVAKEIIGKAVLAYVKHKPDKEGKLWPKVTFVAPSSADKPTQDTPPIQVGEDDLPF